jgi:hypothetical protein
MAALKLRRVIFNRYLQRRYGTVRGICGGQLIQVFVRELPFSLVSTTSSSTDTLRSRATGQLKTIVPRYIMLPNYQRVKMLKKVSGFYQSGAYQ